MRIDGPPGDGGGLNWLPDNDGKAGCISVAGAFLVAGAGIGLAASIFSGSGLEAKSAPAIPEAQTTVEVDESVQKSAADFGANVIAIVE